MFRTVEASIEPGRMWTYRYHWHGRECSQYFDCLALPTGSDIEPVTHDEVTELCTLPCGLWPRTRLQAKRAYSASARSAPAARLIFLEPAATRESSVRLEAMVTKACELTKGTSGR